MTSADDALLARILRTGIANLTTRLSPEAATRDVTATWPAPKAPQLTATFLSSGKTSMDVQLSVPTVLSQSQIDEQVRGQIGNSPDPQRTTVSAAARARYARDRQEYGEDVRVYLEASRKHEDEARRLVHMRVWLKNAGDQVAKDLTVRFHIPKTVVVVPSGMARYAPMSPQEPLEPSAYENPNARRARFDPTPRPSYRELGQTSMYNASQRILPDANGRSIVEQPVVQIPGREGGEAGELMVQFPNWESVKPFDIDVEIRVAGAVANVSRLHVNATRRGGV